MLCTAQLLVVRARKAKIIPIHPMRDGVVDQKSGSFSPARVFTRHSVIGVCVRGVSDVIDCITRPLFPPHLPACTSSARCEVCVPEERKAVCKDDAVLEGDVVEVDDLGDGPDLVVCREDAEVAALERGERLAGRVALVVGV